MICQSLPDTSSDVCVQPPKKRYLAMYDAIAKLAPGPLADLCVAPTIVSPSHVKFAEPAEGTEAAVAKRNLESANQLEAKIPVTCFEPTSTQVTTSTVAPKLKFTPKKYFKKRYLQDIYPENLDEGNKAKINDVQVQAKVEVIKNEVTNVEQDCSKDEKSPPKPTRMCKGLKYQEFMSDTLQKKANKKKDNRRKEYSGQRGRPRLLPAVENSSNGTNSPFKHK